MPRQDISYDFEDFGMTEAELALKYSMTGHPEYSPQSWYQANYTETVIPPYWTWVRAHIRADDDSIPGNDEQGNPVPVPEARTGEQEGQPEAPPELVRLDNVDMFAAHFVAWHSRQKAQMEHFLSIPEGTEIEVKINDEPSTIVTLTGDLRQAFRGGLATGLNYFGELPFKPIPMDETQPAAPAEQAAPVANGAAQ